MKFVYPAGLWSLAGMLVLLAVYLVRRKYDETTLSSTYLWKLAERFSKQNAPAQRIKRALLFAMQLVSVVLACLMIAQPLILLPGADTHLAAILDGSSSMQMADSTGRTRFSRAVDALKQDVKNLPWGSRVTVILAADEAEILADHLPADEVEAALEKARPGWGAGSVDAAMEICQEIVRSDDDAQALLYTDRAYQKTVNVGVRNVQAEDEWNVSILGLREEGSVHGMRFFADAICYGKEASVTFDLYVDGKLQAPETVELVVNGVVQDDPHVFCPKNETVTLSMLARQVYDYTSVRMETHVEDGLSADNSFQLFKQPEKTEQVLLVSDKPYFLEKALSSFRQVDLKTASKPEESALNGQDLYVFDGCIPEELPADGAVWLFDPPRAPKGTDFTLGAALRGVQMGVVSDEENARTAGLAENLSLRDAYVVRFREVTNAGSFEPVLTCGKLPVMLAGRTPAGCEMLVFPFDLQKSSLPMLPDYIILMNNMLEDAVPPMLPLQDVDCGTVLCPKTRPLCGKLFVQLPDLSIRTLQQAESFTPEVPGGYTLMQELPGGREKIFEFYAHLPVEECRTVQPAQEEPLLLTRDAGMEESREEAPREAQFFQPLRLLAGVLLLLLIVEWVVYHREKY